MSSAASIKKGEEVAIIGLRDEILKTTVTGIEDFHKELDAAEAGDNAGILLRGTTREEVERGMVLAKPGSITPHKRFMGQRLHAHAATKVVVTKRSSAATARSSTSARWM